MTEKEQLIKGLEFQLKQSDLRLKNSLEQLPLCVKRVEVAEKQLQEEVEFHNNCAAIAAAEFEVHSLIQIKLRELEK